MHFKIIFLSFFLSASGILSAQTAEKVLRITESQRTGDYYAQQTAAWGKILEKENSNADAWLNYFTAARYSNIFNEGPKIDLEKIVREASVNVPNTFEASYLKFWLKPWGEAAFGHLQNAYKIDPSRTETYHEFSTHYLRNGNMPLYSEFCKKHYLSAANSPGLLSWNYNALINLDQDAILLTEGDNDTYPAWILQEAKGFRKDVLVINTNLLMSEDYRTFTFKTLGLPKFDKDQEKMERLDFRIAMLQHIIDHSQRPTYFGVGSHQKIKAPFETDLYLMGLSFKYSKTAIDELTVLRKGYENDFRLDYLKMSLDNDPHQEELDRYSRSYLPALMKVYTAYRKEKKDLAAQDIKSLILIIGEKSNSLQETKMILAKY